VAVGMTVVTADAVVKVEVYAIVLACVILKE
jgi:hypothetical protein